MAPRSPHSVAHFIPGASPCPARSRPLNPCSGNLPNQIRAWRVWRRRSSKSDICERFESGVQRNEAKTCTDLDKPAPGRLLTDWLLRMDEARNARPHEPQQASEMVKDRNARLADQAEKIAALKRARETGFSITDRRNMAKRELIDTGTDKRYVRHKLGTSFVESDDVGRSLAADRRKRAKKVKSGEGDKGDRPRPKAQSRQQRPQEAASRKGAARKSARRKGGSAASTLPDFIPFATCLLVDRPPNGPDWVHEIKLDGWRIQIRVEDGSATHPHSQRPRLQPDLSRAGAHSARLRQLYH